MSDGPRSNEFIRWGSMKRMNSLLRGSPAFNRTHNKDAQTYLTKTPGDVYQSTFLDATPMTLTHQR